MPPTPTPTPKVEFFMLRGYGGDAYLLKHYSSEEDMKNNKCVSVLIDGGGNSENQQSVYLLNSLHEAKLRVDATKFPLLDYVFLTHFHTDHYAGLMALFNGAPYRVDGVGDFPVYVNTLFLLKEMYIDAARFASLRLDDFHRADLPQLVNRLMAPAPASNIEDVIWGGAAAVPVQDGDIWSVFLRYHRLASQKIDWLVLELCIKAEEHTRNPARAGGSDVVGRLRTRQQSIHERIIAMEKECALLEDAPPDAAFPGSTPDLAELHDGFDYVDFAKCFAKDLQGWHEKCKEFIAAAEKAMKEKRIGHVKLLDFQEKGVDGLVSESEKVVYPSKGKKILDEFSFLCLNGKEYKTLCRAPLHRHSLFPFDLDFFHDNPLGMPTIPNDNYWSRVFYFFDGQNEILLLADSELHFWRNGDNTLRLQRPFPLVCVPHHASKQEPHQFAYDGGKYKLDSTVISLHFFRSDGPGSPGWSARPGQKFIALRNIAGSLSGKGKITPQWIYLYCMTCDDCGTKKDRKDPSKTVLGASNPQSVSCSLLSVGMPCPMIMESLFQNLKS